MSQMICQQAFTVSSRIANHLANTYALEYNLPVVRRFMKNFVDILSIRGYNTDIKAHKLCESTKNENKKMSKLYVRKRGIKR